MRRDSTLWFNCHKKKRVICLSSSKWSLSILNSSSHSQIISAIFETQILNTIICHLYCKDRPLRAGENSAKNNARAKRTDGQTGVENGAGRRLRRLFRFLRSPIFFHVTFALEQIKQRNELYYLQYFLKHFSKVIYHSLEGCE